MEAAMVRTQIQLTEEQAEMLKQMAAEQNVSAAEIIRRGIELMARSPCARPEDDRWQRAIAAITAGRFSSGKTDVAVNHDEYLAEAYAQ
jgi:hypothetical protein